MTKMKLPELHVGRGKQVGPLTVFPVWASTPGPDGLVSGTAAQVQVTERDGHPEVGQLVVTNTGSSPALLVEGELLEGGWQHRVLEHDVVLEAEMALIVAVACVESGRWHGGVGHVRRGRRASGSVRATLATSAPADRQQNVWGQVTNLEVALGSSETSSFVEHLDRLSGADRDPGTDRPASDRSPGSGKVDALVADVRGLAPIDGQRGVVVGVGGQPVLLELYPSTESLTAALPELLTGLLLDALASNQPVATTPSRRVRRLMKGIDGRQVARIKDVDAGAGQSYSLDTEHAVVRGITLDQEWAHLTVFNRDHALVEV